MAQSCGPPLGALGHLRHSSAAATWMTWSYVGLTAGVRSAETRTSHVRCTAPAQMGSRLHFFVVVQCVRTFFAPNLCTIV